MLIQYIKHEPPTARTWFGRLNTEDTRLLTALLTDFLIYCTAKSVRPKQDPWRTVSETTREIWGHSTYQQHSNNMLSVIGGILDKLRRGGDLTEKQLIHLKKIAVLLPQLGDAEHTWPTIVLEEVTTWNTKNPITALQNSLFHQS